MLVTFYFVQLYKNDGRKKDNCVIFRKRKAQEEEEEEQRKKVQKEWDKNYEVSN